MVTGRLGFLELRDLFCILYCDPYISSMITQVRTDVKLAQLEWVQEGILVIRFRSAGSMDLEGVVEIVNERLRMCKGRPAAVLTILPPDMDADIKVSVTDHGPLVKDLTLAEATVAHSGPHRRLAELYYSHFPQPFPTAVFRREEDALTWLRAHLNAIA